MIAFLFERRYSIPPPPDVLKLNFFAGGVWDRFGKWKEAETQSDERLDLFSRPEISLEADRCKADSYLCLASRRNGCSGYDLVRIVEHDDRGVECVFQIHPIAVVPTV